MAVEIYINNNPLELKEGTRMQFNYTVADLFNIGLVAVGYSNVFDAPLTPSNTLTMQGLGLVGNNSPLPYQKIDTVVKYDGFDIIPDGRLVVEDTSNSYRMAIQDGIIDFFKEIENKTIGKDLVITDLKHDKTVENVLYSITDTNYLYRYVVANFGGKTVSDTGAFNIDYLVPVVKLSYFWNKIFETFGYTYSGSIFSNPDFTEAHITFPTAPANEKSIVPFASIKKNSHRDNNPVKNGNTYSFPNSYRWSTTSPVAFPLPRNWNFRSPTADTYRFNILPIGFAKVQFYNNPSQLIDEPFFFEIWKGSQKIEQVMSRVGSLPGKEFEVSLAAGEELTFKITYTSSLNTAVYLQINSIEMNVSKLTLGQQDFSEAFADFTIKDYIKEIIWRYGLTPFYNKKNKHIEFLTIDEKINFNNYVDWSSKYINRNKESYLYGSYGQSNVFQHKYNDEGDNFNNGSISISNVNLEPTKVIVNSKIYSSDKKTRPIGDPNRKTNIYPIWRGEINEGSGGIEVNYKGLNGRYYIMKLRQVNEVGSFRSDILNSVPQSSPYYFMPNSDNTHYSELVAKYYPTYQKLMNDFKMHEIEIALSLPDILNLDFKKLYYFEQEGSFYILNKLQWEEGKTCKGEFIKINK